MQFCSLCTVCLQWSATDPVCITRHTQTVSQHTEDNTYLLNITIDRPFGNGVGTDAQEKHAHAVKHNTIQTIVWVCE